MLCTAAGKSGASPSTFRTESFPRCKAIRHGRRLQELINEAGVRYVRALKRDDVFELPKR